MSRSRRGKRSKLYLLQRSKCFYCLRVTGWDEFTVDHLVPLSRGGTDRWSNLVGCCKECNGWKADAEVAPEWVIERGRSFQREVLT